MYKENYDLTAMLHALTTLQWHAIPTVVRPPAKRPIVPHSAKYDVHYVWPADT